MDGEMRGDSKILLDIQRHLGEIGTTTNLTREELKSIKDYMIEWQGKMSERVDNFNTRLTLLETQINDIDRRVTDNAHNLKNHETPEQFLQKKSYTLVLAAGAALIGALVSKLGDIVDWFRGL